MRKTKKLLSILVAVVLAFSCFAAIPMTASAATTVTTAAQLTSALADSSVSHIIIGAAIKDGKNFAVNRNVTIEGSTSVSGYHLDGDGTTNTMLSITGGTVTLKNLKIRSNGDTISIDKSPNITISGGEIYNGNTSKDRWGGIYVASAFKGYLKLIDDAVIQSKNYAIYSTTGTGITGSIALYDCQITKLSGSHADRKDLINLRSTLTIRIGGGDAGQEAVLTSAYGKLIWSEQSATGLIEIRDGATLNQTSGAWGIHVNTGYRLMVMGGSINCKGTAIVMDSQSGYSKISGGTITSGDSDRTIQKNNGAITITGGTIVNTNGGAAIKTSSTDALKGDLWVEGGTYNTTATPFVFNGAFSTNFQNTITYEGDEPMVKVASGVTVCLDNAHLTSNDLVILPSDGAIITTKGTSSMTSVNGIVVPAGTALPEGLTVNNGGEAVKIVEVNGVKYDVMADALAALSNGGTLNIIAEVNDVALDVDKTYTVVTTGDGVITGQIIITAGNVTLKDITAKGVKFNNAANVVIDGGNYNGGNDIGTLIADSAATGSVTVKNGANLTCGNKYVVQLYENSNATFNLEDGTFTDTDGDAFSIGGLGTINFGKADGTGNVTVSGLVDIIWWTAAGGADVNVYEGTTISGENTFNINGSNNPTINIYGGEFNPTGHGMKIQKTSTINVSGGTFTTTGADKAGIYLYNNAPIVNVSGGTFNGMAIRTTSDCSGGEVNVTGGTFNDVSEDYMFKFNNPILKHNFTGATIARTENEAPIFYLADGVYVEFNNCSIETLGGFSGGTVFEGTSNASVKFIETELADDSNETVTIIYDKVVCKIGDKEYNTFEKAIAAVENGGTITLIDDAVGNIDFNVDKTYYINCDGYAFLSIPTVSAGNVTFTNINAVGVKAEGDAVVLIDGGVINGTIGLTLGSTFTGTLTATGGVDIAVGQNAVMISAGNTGTLNIENATITSSKEMINVQGGGTLNFGKEDGTGSVVMGRLGDNIWYNGAGSATVNVYKGTTINGGTPFNLNSSGKPTINIYGGTLKSDKSRQIFNFQKAAIVNIYGGSFTNNTASTNDDKSMGEVAWVRANAGGSVINITGGSFGAASIRSTSAPILGTVTGVNDVVFNVSNVTLNMKYTWAAIAHKGGTGSVTLNNVTVNQVGSAPAIDVTGGAKEVTITDCNFNAINKVVNFAVDSGKTTTVTFEGETTLTSNYEAEPIAKTEGVVINGLDTVTTVLKYDGVTGRMLRIAGKTRDDYPNVNRDMRIEGNTTYTYSFNYRATAGAVPYITVQYKNAEGSWIDVAATADTGSYAEYTFTTGDVPAEGNTFRIRLGSKGKAAIASSGTAYFANVTLKAADSDVNLIENGDFASGPNGWNIGNNDPVACYDFEFIPYVAELFDDEALSNNTAALLLEGGDRHEIQFFTALEAGASYTFKYDYRANNGHPQIGVAGTDVKLVEVSTEDFTKTYTLTNNGAEAVKVRVWFRMGADGEGAKFYISNLSLIKDGDANNTNIIADLNPVFGTADNIRMSQNGENAVKNIIGHGWLGNLKSDSDGGNVNVGSDKYTSIVEIPEDFFVEYQPAEIQVNLKKVLIGILTASINPYEDANNDGEVNVKDLIRVQKMALGIFGSDAAEAELKAVIDAGVETAVNGTAYYVDTVEALKDAVNEYGTKTIFLKRGNTYRSTSEIALNANTTLSAYGEGAKPEVIGSAKDYKTATWTDNGNNIWSVELGSSKEVGNIYLFKGDEILPGTGFKSSNVENGTTRITSNDQLVNEGDYYQNNGVLYLYSEGNPATVYNRIEIAQCDTLIGLNSNVTVENIAVKFTGGHAIQGSRNLQNVTVRYCEVGYVGGQKNSTDKDSHPLGNGIEFGNGGSNIEASYNYVYQCYDSGITPQAYTAGYNFDGVRITNNLLTNNFYGLEIWGTKDSLLKDILVEGNIIADTGYCWSFNQRPEGGNIPMFSAHIYGGRNSYNTNANNSIIIRNNTFSNARVNIICWYWGEVEGADAERYEKLTTSGNIYYQSAPANTSSWVNGQIMMYGDIAASNYDYASSQDSLVDAVEKFDVNPLLVAWIN